MVCAKKNKKIILIFPRTGFDFGAGLSPPHNLLALAAPLLKEGFKFKLIDQRVEPEWEKILRKELLQCPVCVGISTMTGIQLKFAIEVSRFVKKNSDTPVIWGGHHSTFLPNQTIKEDYVDIVIRGEGEATFLDLVFALEKRKNLDNIKGISFKAGKRLIHNADRDFIDIDNLLPTPWQLIDVEQYVHKSIEVKGSNRELDIGETSRGCPFSCKFCYNHVFHKSKWRALSVRKSVEKILYAKNQFHLSSFWIRDDNFFVDIKRVKNICKALIEKKLNIPWYASGLRIDIFNKMDDETIFLLKKAGCVAFRFGAESGCDRVLKFINKGITKEDILRANKKAKRFNIKPSFSFMIGLPTETYPEIMETVNLYKRLKRENSRAEMHGINIYTPYPGTDLFEIYKRDEKGLPTKLEQWINYHHLIIHAPGLNPKEKHLVENINLISYAISDTNMKILPFIKKILFYPMYVWLKYRWNRNKFRNSFELKALRKILFSQISI